MKEATKRKREERENDHLDNLEELQLAENNGRRLTGNLVESEIKQEEVEEPSQGELVRSLDTDYDIKLEPSLKLEPFVTATVEEDVVDITGDSETAEDEEASKMVESPHSLQESTDSLPPAKRKTRRESWLFEKRQVNPKKYKQNLHIFNMKKNARKVQTPGFLSASLFS